MILLQNYERELNCDRAPGIEVAADHFDYVLKECRDSDGEIYVSTEDSVVIGFVSVYIEHEEKGDRHLFDDYTT